MKILTLCTALFLTLTMIPTVFAQPGIAPSGPDNLGIYIDPLCSGNGTNDIGTQVTVYVVLTQMSGSDLTSFEFNITSSAGGSLFLLNSTINAANAVNLATAPEFFVGIAPGNGLPPGPQQELVLVTLTYLITTADPTYLYLEPTQTVSPTIPGSMAYLDETTQQYLPMYPASGDHANPVFGFNTAGVPLGGGDITVNPNPDYLGATWTLTGPDGYLYNGTGDESLVNLAYGDYSLVWADIPDWQTPTPNPASVYLFEQNTSETINGTYQPLTGQIVVDGGPVEITPTWQLSGPDAFELSGSGDDTVTSLQPGEYSLFWNDDAEWTAPALNPVPVILAAGGSETVQGDYRALPRILSVEDVPNDQGRQVRLTWGRVPYDSPSWPTDITGYGVYRQQPATSGQKLAGWDFLGTAPARTDTEYQMVVATLCDSTVSGGYCPTTFMVSAMTDETAIFFDSLPAMGYSVDNLRPVTPSGLKVDFGASANVLTWDAPTDSDVDHYLVYRTAGLPPTAQDAPLAQVSGTEYQDDGGWNQSYWLVAVDHAGNRSDFTEWSNTDVSGVDGSLPRVVALRDAAPNPFNPATKISFDLPRSQHVNLAIYGIDGKRVKVLVDEVRAAGTNQVTWRGMNDAGQRVASGTYLYRMEAEGFSETRRIMMVK